MKGRKPKPTLLHELHGNPSKLGRSARAREPRPVGDLDGSPEWMSEGQRAGWEYAIAHAPPGLLKLVDCGVLAVWVCAEDTHREAAQRVARFGLVTKSPEKGVPMQNPFLAIMNRQAEIMLRAAAELGFTPACRPRIQTSEATEPDARRGDELDRLLEQRPSIN